MIRVLLLSADPKENHPLNLDQEFRRIENVHEKSKYRDEFHIIRCLATTYQDLRKKLLEHKPSIIHFCGHGVGKEGIVLVDENGKKETITTEVLADLFKICQEENKNIYCIVFNACHAEFQAKEITKYIKYSIGMNREIKDADAINFATAFYQSIFSKTKIKTAFELGCNEINRFVSNNCDTARAEYDPEPGDKTEYHHEIPQLIVNAYLHERNIYDLNQALPQAPRIITYEQWHELHEILSIIDFKTLKNVYLNILNTLKEAIVAQDILSAIKNIADLEERLLENYPHKDNDNLTILEFARHLTTRKELDKTQKAKIKQWIEKIAHEKNIDLSILSENLQPSNTVLNSYLLITIIENTGIASNFSLEAELIYNYQEKHNYKSISITSEQAGINGISIDKVLSFELPRLIDRAIEELNPPYNLTIELFVPSDYLGKTYDLLEISTREISTSTRKRGKQKAQFTALGGKYQFTVRCLERYKSKTLYNDHLKVWNNIKFFLEQEKSEKIVEDKCHNLRLLNEKHNFEKLCTEWNRGNFYSINIIDELPLDEEKEEYYNYFYNFVDSGVPVSLWIRRSPDSLCYIDGENHTIETIEKKFKEILHINSFNDLSEIFKRIHELRQNAHDEGCDEAKKHLGYHLGFICDHPDLIPYNLATSLKGNNRLQGSN